MKLRTALFSVFLLAASAPWASAGGKPQGLIHLEGETLGRSMAAARDAGLPLYLKLEDGVVVGGKPADLKLPELRGLRARYLGDLGKGRPYLITGKIPLEMKGLSDLGSLLLAEKNASLIVADGVIDLDRLPFGAMAVALPGSPLPNPPLPEPSGRALDYDPAIAALAAQVDTSSVRDFLLGLQAFGSRGALSANRFAVAESLRQWFLGMGITDVRSDTFLLDGSFAQVNVVATVPGTVDTASSIIVCGHCDDTPGPGVDDNATGTAAALEMGRVLAANPPARTVRLVALAAEETGLNGGFHCAQQAYQSGSRLNGVINYDMIGHHENTSTYRVIRYAGSEYLGDLMGQATQLYTYLSPVYGSGGMGSDSYAFWLYGFPVTWGFESIFSNVYHTARDSISYVSVPYCTEVIRAGLATVVSLAKHPDVVRGVTVTDAGDGARLVVSWLPNTESNLAGYWVCYGGQSGVYADSAFTSGPSDTISGLAADTLYYILVKAVNVAGLASLAAFEVSATPRLAPAPPAEVAAKAVSHGISLSWRRNLELDMSGYRLYRAVNDTSFFDSLNISLVTDTAYVDAPLSGAYRYYYGVRAFDADGNFSLMSERAYGRPLTLDQGVLVVDETYNAVTGSMPRDTAQDQFYDFVLSGYRHEQFEFGTAAERPVLADFVPYSAVLWHGDDYSNLLASGSVSDLKQYLDWGGNLWIAGWKPTSDLQGNTSYPRILEDTSFVKRYLKLGSVNLSGSVDSFQAATGLLGYPSISVDPAKVPLASWGGTMRYIESFVPADSGEVICAIDMRNDWSAFEGLPCGVRFLGPNFSTVLFGFPLFFMDRDQARLAVERVMSDFGETGVEGDPELKAPGLELLQSTPNPFSSSTTIRYHLPVAGRVSLKVYNVAGQVVRTLVDESRGAGRYLIAWDGRNDRGGSLSSGIYLVRLAASGSSRTYKMTLVR